MDAQRDDAERAPRRGDRSWRARFFALLEYGATLETAAAYVGRSSALLRRKLMNHRGFARKFRQAEARFEFAMLKNLHDEKKKAQWRASAWILARRFPERYTEPKASTVSPHQVQELLTRLTEALFDGVADSATRRAAFDRMQLLTAAFDDFAGGAAR